MHAGADGFFGRLGPVTVRAITVGSLAGAVVGSVIGLAIGIWAYLPTAPFAAVEGAVLGSVSGTVLAFLICGVAALARLWARR